MMEYRPFPCCKPAIECAILRLFLRRRRNAWYLQFTAAGATSHQDSAMSISSRFTALPLMCICMYAPDARLLPHVFSTVMRM